MGKKSSVKRVIIHHENQNITKGLVKNTMTDMKGITDLTAVTAVTVVAGITTVAAVSEVTGNQRSGDIPIIIK